MNDMPISTPEIPPAPPAVRWWKRSLRILVALLIVGAGIAGATYLKKTAPKANKRPPAKWIPVVRVEPLQPSRHQVVVQAMGTVIPSQRVLLKSQVSGQVIALHPEFTEGGFLEKGDRIVQIDRSDYKLALTQQQNALVDRQYALKLEMGRQDVALREWQLLNGQDNSEAFDSELALRKPHLEKAKADVAVAEAVIARAALDLARTNIKAPFNAMVLSKAIDIGSQVGLQEALAEIVGTDTYWVQASLPIERLDWIQVPRRIGDPGSMVRIVYGQGHMIDGTVARLMGSLESEGRMARLLIAVDDPLRRRSSNPQGPPLLLGEYVRVEIQGRVLDNVFTIPRTALRDDNTVWLVKDNARLDVRKVLPVWRDSETVVLRDELKTGDRLIVTDLPAPVAGMEVRIESDQPAVLQPDGQPVRFTARPRWSEWLKKQHRLRPPKAPSVGWPVIR